MGSDGYRMSASLGYLIGMTTAVFHRDRSSLTGRWREGHSEKNFYP